MIYFKFFLYIYFFSFFAKEKISTKKNKHKNKSKIKRDKNILKLQKKILKKEKNDGYFSKKKPPKDYFSQVFNPLNSNELDSKISEAINYGAQVLLIVNWRDDNYDNFVIGQLIQFLDESNDLFNYYGILVVNLQTRVSSLQEVVKVLGFGDAGGVDNEGGQTDTRNYHVGLIMCILPEKAIPQGTTYFVENSTLNFSSAKLIMGNSDLMEGSKENYSSTGSSKHDPNVLTSINLSNDLPGKIKNSIQNYLNDSSIGKLKDKTFYAKTKNKITKEKKNLGDKLKNNKKK